MKIEMERSQEERDNYVEELYERVIEGDIRALERLSRFAMCGSQLAKELVDKIDSRTDLDFTKSQK